MEEALYSDAELVAIYDLINSGRSDFDFYLSQIPCGSLRILDIGCGTGTFAIELAALGHIVTGLDPAGGMIAFAQDKLGADKVTWIEGDSREIPETTQFDLAVMTGHAFQCLVSDEQIACLFNDVSKALPKNGLFMFETRNRAAQPWLKWTPEHAHDPFDLGSGSYVQVIHDTLTVDLETVSFREIYHFLPEDRQQFSDETLRFASKTHIENLATQAGFTCERVFGDWTGSSFDAAKSPEIIFRLRKTGHKVV